MNTLTLNHISLSSKEKAATIQQSAKHNHAYLTVFVIALITCWSPINALGYLAPWMAVAAFVLLTRHKRTIENLLILISLWFINFILHYPLTPDFAVQSAILSLITYGSFVFSLCIPIRQITHVQSLRRMEQIARWVLVLESILGIAQSIYGFTATGSFDVANGDYVEGTIHPALAAEMAFSNPIFAVNIVMLLLFLFPSTVVERKHRGVYLLGLVALILASVVHVILFTVIAVVLAVILYRPTILKQKSVLMPMLYIGFVVVVSFVLLRQNLTTVKGFAQATLNQQTPRTEVLRRVLTEMPEDYPYMPFIGLGPGQFSSLAGLIGTGQYFGTPRDPQPLPLLPQSMSQPFQINVMDLWLEISLNNTGNNTSSTYKPYFSWLSVYTEFGIIGITILLLFVTKTILAIKFRYQNLTQMFQAISIGTGIILIFLLGVQENYWEVAQAIFPGLVMLKAQYSFLQSSRRHNLSLPDPHNT